MKKCIIASTSTIHGSGYLEYILNDLANLFSNTNEVLFIPYAKPNGISHDEYTQIAQQAFQKINIALKGIHSFADPIKAIKDAKGIFTGGGNTFLLVSQLYKNDLLTVLKEVIEAGTPYLGTSAGSNICGLDMKTTNDMPIIYPPGFKTIGILPFNINPHYLDPDPTSTHKGETRETRIKEFHTLNSQPVIGLREGSWLELSNNDILLKGALSARVFEQHKKPYEVPSGSSFANLN
ncbi:dipeptidase PepE [Aquimarina hainanensis]|uniref:Dipeptidase PepE n=1 Tax=Aquimarina hainanensis TaxID=1578017 RepID=A0ABW5N8B2_9FLAO